MFDGVAFRVEATPELVEKGRDTVLRIRPHGGGAAITPSSATVTVRDGSGVAIVTDAAATPSAGAASYTLDGDLTADLPLGEGWLVTWTATLPGDTVPRVFEIAGALVRHRLHPVVAEPDLYRRVRGLDPNGHAPLTRYTDYRDFLADSWSTIQGALVQQGERPWRILSPEALREVHTLLTLARIFEDMASRLNPAYDARAKDYLAQFEAEWKKVRVEYDRSDLAQPTGHRTPTRRPLFLG